MMKTKLFIGLVSVFVAAMATVVTVQALERDQTKMSKLALANLDALVNPESGEGGESLTERIKDWWNSKVYDCEAVGCTVTVEVAIQTPYGHIMVTKEAHGTQENCVDGDSVAHCWECESCNASIL